MSSPKVSIIIPTYNRLELLKRALKSVEQQTFQDFEIIVVDDGSNDGTKDFFRGYKNQKLNYFFKENEGLPSKSRNFGIAKANGQYIAFLDCDDYWYPTKLEKQVDFLEKNFSFGLVCTSGRTHTQGKEITLGNHILLKKTGYVFWTLVFRNFIITSSVLVKRDLLERYGVFNDTRDLRISEDFDLWLRISPFTKFKFLSNPMVYYQVHQNNISGDYIENLDYADRVIKFHLSKRNIPDFIKKVFHGLTPLKKFFRLRKDKPKRLKYLDETIKASPFFVFLRLIKPFLRCTT